MHRGATAGNVAAHEDRGSLRRFEVAGSVERMREAVQHDDDDVAGAGDHTAVLRDRGPDVLLLWLKDACRASHVLTQIEPACANLIRDRSILAAYNLCWAIAAGCAQHSWGEL